MFIIPFVGFGKILILLLKSSFKLVWFEILIFKESVFPLPSLVVAFTITVPLAIAVNKPLLLMLAIEFLSTDHVTEVSVAFLGSISA